MGDSDGFVRLERFSNHRFDELQNASFTPK